MDSFVVGIFDTQSAAEQAREQLLAAGFAASDVSFTSAEGGSADLSSSTATSSASTVADADRPGPIARFFENLFGTGDDVEARDRYADTYHEAFRRGACGVSVRASSDAEIDRAQSILNQAGAVDIDSRASSWREEGWTGRQDVRAAPIAGAEASPAALAAASPAREGTTQKLQEVEEELRVGKRSVARGGVRIFSRVVEVPVEQSVTLREEHANVERRTVDRPATEADFASFKEGSIEVREMAEEAVVSKTARVVGEVEISKSATEREETVRDTVRRTEVDVEQIGGDEASVGRSSVRSAESGRSMAYADVERPADGGSANRDPLTGEVGAHPVGTGVGAVAGGVAAGAAAGSVAGPVGTAVGAAAGAVAGGLAGKEVAEELDPTDETKIRTPR
jgi:uncharacterized protein (TIGR02271 family)